MIIQPVLYTNKSVIKLKKYYSNQSSKYCHDNQLEDRKSVMQYDYDHDTELQAMGKIANMHR